MARKKEKRRFLVEIDADAVGDYTDRELIAYLCEAVITWAKGGSPDDQLFDLTERQVKVKKAPKED